MDQSETIPTGATQRYLIARAAASGDTSGVVPVSLLPVRVPRRRHVLAATVGLGLILVVMGGIFFYSRHGAGSPAAASVPVTKPAPVLSPATATTQAQAAKAVEGTPGTVSTPAPVLDAADIATLRARLGQFVEVRGTPIATGRSKSGTVLFLNFARPHQGLSLVFFVEPGVKNPAGHDARNLESIEPFVGHPVSVQGQLGDHAGDLQIVIESLEQIKLLP